MSNTVIDNTLKRGFMFLEDSCWEEADKYFEKVLDEDSENANAYLGKLLADMKARSTDGLSKCGKDFSDNEYYRKAMRFGDSEFNGKLENCLNSSKYAGASNIMINAKTADDYRKAKIIFFNLGSFADSEEKARICCEAITEIEAVECRQAEIKKSKVAKLVKLSKIIIPIIIAIIAFIIILITIIIPCIKYNSAIKLMGSGEYMEATAIFIELDDYKDSKEKLYECEICSIGESNVGDYVYYGTNNDEKIEWIVIEKENDKALLVSRYIIDCVPYNKSFDSVTWDKCTLRKWLNGSFLESGFSDIEKKAIILSNISSQCGEIINTKDRMFLLSIDEAEKYFNDKEDLKAGYTIIAKNNGLEYNESLNSACWFLRSSATTKGSKPTHVVYVDASGNIIKGGIRVDIDSYGVRPAMWITVN